MMNSALGALACVCAGLVVLSICCISLRNSMQAKYWRDWCDDVGGEESAFKIQRALRDKDEAEPRTSNVVRLEFTERGRRLKLDPPEAA